jgi:hypothetical protein
VLCLSENSLFWNDFDGGMDLCISVASREHQRSRSFSRAHKPSADQQEFTARLQDGILDWEKVFSTIAASRGTDSQPGAAVPLKLEFFPFSGTTLMERASFGFWLAPTQRQQSRFLGAS